MEKLKRICDVLDGVAEAFKPLYEEKGGKFHLVGIDDHDDYAKVKDLRTEAASARVKNNELRGRLEAFKDLDPDSVRQALLELESTKAELAAGGNKDKAKFEEAVTARLKTELAPLQAKHDGLLRERTTLSESVAKYEGETKLRTIDDAMKSACREMKVAASAVDGKWPDALHWARANAVIGEDGKITDKSTGLPLKDALRAMQDAGEQPHWFGTSAGGGSLGSTDNGVKTNANPWAAETWNISKQMQIETADPNRASALARQGGVELGAPFHPKNGMKIPSLY